MLLNFRCKNFKSFKEGFELNFRPVKRLTELNYSILSQKYGDKEVYALPTSVLYGPNASGKTSVINALSCFKQIVTSGSIEDAIDDSNNDHVSRHKELIPFFYAKKGIPTFFEITFIDDGIKITYSLSFIINNDGNKRYINEETLIINDNTIFDRSKNSIDGLNVSSIKDLLNKGYNIKDTEKHRKYIQNNINPVRILLTSDFYSFCSKQISDRITSYFNNKLIVVNSLNPGLNHKQRLEKDYLNSIANSAGITGNVFAYKSDNENEKSKLVSILSKEKGKISYIDSELIESTGTLNLFSVMPLIIKALTEGAVLFVDELDSSLHPMVVLNIISMFHNDELNRNKSQLIFNTHNPIYLKNKVMRRDEIKFVEKDKETKSSILYSLSDFRANGEASVRKTTDYLKNYFLNRYGAIENIDFTDVLQQILLNNASKTEA